QRRSMSVQTHGGFTSRRQRRPHREATGVPGPSSLGAAPAPHSVSPDSLFSENLPHRRQPLDVIAADLKYGQQRDRDEGAKQSPHPEPERQTDEDGHGIQSEPASQQHRAYHVRLQQGH